MEIIPVIDLMHGQVVHARRGRRETYRPLESPLCRNSEPEAVVEGLLRLHGFDTFYVADLDALMGQGHQAATVESLTEAFPELTFWIDRGWPEPGDGEAFARDDRVLTVIGSESLGEARLPLLADPGAPFILSLDFRGDDLVGPARLLDRPELWPETVILMSLSHVGGAAGPDFERAEQFRHQHPGRRFVAAGGVRHARDLERLEVLGIGAVLMASALHSGAVDSEALARYS
jgi:phosphoribosylformimino-5-aminoimidazole carboxamide ribotide isomerase